MKPFHIAIVFISLFIETQLMAQTVRQSGSSDSLQHRDNAADSITIFYKLLNQPSNYHLPDYNHDYYTYFPVPLDYVTLGNLGNAAHSLLFATGRQKGFDEGFHAFDIYKFHLFDTKFYETTKPYTELGYSAVSPQEQMIKVLHTQNIRSNFNVGLSYRLINAPGIYQSQNTNHSNLSLFSYYQSLNKRYQVYAVAMVNTLRSSENGGMIDDSKLNDPTRTDRSLINTRLGGTNPNVSANLFSTSISVGNTYRDWETYWQQRYDFGQKDSVLLNDTGQYTYLFYPRMRIEHSLRIRSNTLQFQDNVDNSYSQYFNYNPTNTNLLFRDRWKEITNEAKLYLFPLKTNTNQFLSFRAGVQKLIGLFTTLPRTTYFNTYVGSAYRNTTRNKVWDMTLAGQLFLNGYNAGDFSVTAHLERVLSSRLGNVAIDFENLNHSPSALFSGLTSFPIIPLASIGKENSTVVKLTIGHPQYVKLSASYALISNYSYYSDFFSPAQEARLVYVAYGGIEKNINLVGHFKWYASLHFQKTSPNAPIHLPLVLSINKLVFEAHPYPNLNLFTGLEITYNTPYQPDNYSPFIGQFFLQSSFRTTDNRPVVNAFLNLQIRRFNAFVRFENLNTFHFKTLDFTSQNLTAPHYADLGLRVFRLGISWAFVN